MSMAWQVPQLTSDRVLQQLLMVAILEASPTYAEFFLSEPDSLLTLLCELVWQGLRMVATLSIGIPIFLHARRRL